jgi:4-amino-4-deoxy-L-arabinose transferase-like glycosyltransferase
VSVTTPVLPRRTRPSAGTAPRPSRLRGLVRGRPDDPRWIRPALLAVVVAAALLLLWDLTASGYSNTYYAAAARAGSVSWKAWFFGSLDPGSFITVDKPPLSLWLTGLSARVLGFSSLSVLLPQALCTIGAVGLLYATVRRAFGPGAGLAAAAALALTPVTVAIGRVNNPDALLVLLLVASAYLVQRAVESGRTRHLVAAGAVVGLAFMTKMLQGWMVVPALVATYVLAGPPRLAVRLRQLVLAGGAMVLVSAAWPVAVSLWPGAKPYIGGSTDGGVWDLILGYNGFGRLTGDGGGGAGAGFGGAAGWGRLLNEQVGGQIAWLIPLAAISLVAGLWLTRSTPRTDRRRAAWVLFGVWAVVHVAVFSGQRGIFHPYYVSALAPAVAALAGAGVVLLGRWSRSSWAGVAVWTAALVASAWIAVELLRRTPDLAPPLRVVIPLAAGVAVAAAVARRAALAPRGPAAVAAVATALAVAAGPAAYSLATTGRALNGNNVVAGPASAAQGMGRGAGGAPGASAAPGARSGPPSSSAAPPARAAAGARGAGGGGSVSARTVAYLRAHQGSAKYLVAATGSQTTAGIIIQTGEPVVTIGGFNGGDAAPTVSELAAMVSRGELRYLLLSSGGGGGPGGSRQGLTSWVKAHGTAVTGAGTSGGTLYRLTA